MYKCFRCLDFVGKPAGVGLCSGFVQGLILTLVTVAAVQADTIARTEFDKPPRPRGKVVNVDVGPYVQFTGPFSTVVRWDTPDAHNSIVEYGTTESLGLRVEDPSITINHEITLRNLQYRTRYYYRVGYMRGAAEFFTDVFTFDNAINYTRLDCSDTVSSYPADALTSLYETAADHILSQTGIKKGFCLVYGCGEGQLAFELARRSDLIVVGVDTDLSRINTAMNRLMEAGIYGARIKVRKVDSLENLQFTKYFFNLIISDYVLSEGRCVGSAIEMFRVLRPGGTAFLGQPVGCPNRLTETELETWLNAKDSICTTTDDSNGLWSKVVRKPLLGAAQWPRQYGNPDNASNAGEALEGSTQTGQMMIQWIGSPGADFGADRNPRMPAPVTANGRLYHQGLDRILGMDVYNGAVYWSLEIPGLLRVNTPRDGGYVCADEDGLYVAVDDDCWFLDGDTGTRSKTYKLNDNARSGVTTESLVLDELNEGWVYVSPVPPQVAWDGGAPWDAYRSSSTSVFELTPQWDFDFVFFVTVVDEMLYFGSSVTDSVHCLNARTGRQKWFFTTNGPVRYPPSYDDGKLYFGSDDGYLYCINALDGSFIWKYSPAGDTRLIGNNGSLIPMWPVRTGTAVLDGKVYFAASLVNWQTSYLCSVDAETGLDSDEGLYRVSGGVTPMGAIMASPTRLYLLQGRLHPYAFNRANGSVLGTFGERGQSGCYALLTSDSRFVRGHAKFHASDYELAEHNTDAKDRIATHPSGRRLVVSGTAAYLLSETSLSAIRRSNGSARWSVPCDCPHALILAGDVLFAGGTNKVAAYSIANGDELWSRVVKGRVRGLAAAGGRLFVSTDTGSIHMFGRAHLSSDLNKDGLVNLLDLTMFANDYLGCTDPTSTQWPCENLLDYVKW